jgi:hypothetical protein
MYKKIRKCRPLIKKPRHRVTIALDPDIWDRFQPTLKKEWGDSFTSWIEFAMTCYSQTTCDDCPYAEEEEKGKGRKPSGIGKIKD